MKLGYNLTIEQSQKLTMTPELIQAIRILQYNNLELQDFVQEEINQNPILEYAPEYSDEHPDEHSESEKEEDADSDFLEKIREAEYDDISYKQWDYRPRNEDREVSFEQFASKEETLQDHLKTQLSFSNLKGLDRTIGKYLVEAIDENGYLTVETEAVARAFSLPESRVDDVLDVIQTFEPTGVGARDLRECLLIQLAAKGLLEDSVEYVITNHLNDLGDNKLSKVSRITGLTLEQIQMICDLIRTLEPKPGRQFSSGDSVKYVIPDILVEKNEDGYQITTNDGSVPHLMVSQYYMSLSNRDAGDEELNKYINDKYNSAVWLIKSIEQRKQTIYNVAAAVVRHQFDFFEKGSKYLKTLTLREIAEDLHIHESTVSRSINGKYMQTPRGVFEIKYFFSSGVSSTSGDGLSSNSIKSFIKDIVASEDPKRPYSDQDMVEILKEKGIEISRRTVAKYREGMGILSSSKRRRY